MVSPNNRPSPLGLDVLVATFQRPAMLERALDSLLTAPVPDALMVRINVIQNDHDEATTAVIAAAQQRYGSERLGWIRETRNGKSHALNTGIRHTRGDLIGIIDDDEEVDPGWFTVVAREFADPSVQYIGGPCLPLWGATPPGWLPRQWSGVIGVVDDGDRVLEFGREAPGILMGGNSVIRRALIDQVGHYSESLGPSARHRLLSGEDEDLYSRLLASGARGLYVPDLRIHHYVPPNRLTKSYYRRWSFWHGVSRSVLDRVRPLPVSRIGRVPRFLVGTAVRSLVHGLGLVRTNPAARFSSQLAFLHLVGFLYGSYCYRRGAN
jgi:glycosyltransferase involved in cell wall biosynthesis